MQSRDAGKFPALRVLLVEDVFLVAEVIAQTLTDWGCEVIGPAARVPQALRLVDANQLDGALLDVNLAGERCFPVAAALAERGVPFVFLTGYDVDSEFPARFRDEPRLSKPVDNERLKSMIASHFATAEL